MLARSHSGIHSRVDGVMLNTPIITSPHRTPTTARLLSAKRGATHTWPDARCSEWFACYILIERDFVAIFLSKLNFAPKVVEEVSKSE